MKILTFSGVMLEGFECVNGEIATRIFIDELEYF